MFDLFKTWRRKNLMIAKIEHVCILKEKKSSIAYKINTPLAGGCQYCFVM
jgi:hypothetical protein